MGTNQKGNNNKKNELKQMNDASDPVKLYEVIVTIFKTQYLRFFFRFEAYFCLII